jgi:nitrite reductase/ring-hydroxylating ferredoxin subunit
MSEDKKPSGPDLTQGVRLADFTDGKLVGHVGDDDVLLVLAGAEVLAIDPSCSHYHGPLAEGLVVGDTIRCPWHHACFSLRSGEAVRAPALSPLSVWQVVRDGERIIVRRKLEPARRPAPHRADQPGKIVIVDDAAPPVDRPNLSKDYLAGQAPED